MSDVNAPVLGYKSTSYTFSNQQTLINALSARQSVTLGTKTSVSAGGLFGSHAYIVTGYTASTAKFTLFNPWGTSHPAPLTWAQLQSNCTMFVVTNTSTLTGVASSPVTSASPIVRTTITTTSMSSFATQATRQSLFAGLLLDNDREASSAASSVSDAYESSGLDTLFESDFGTDSALNSLQLQSNYNTEFSLTDLTAELLDMAFLDLNLKAV